jgi:hypothetical protein
MLYIEDDERTLWPSVAAALASLEPLDMVLCLSEGDGPESFRSPFEAPDTEEYLESVTDYGDGTHPACSSRVAIDDALISWLESRTSEFEEWGDSLSIYRPDKNPLVAAVIPHEGMILVADEYGSALAASGFRLSSDPPDWWSHE